PGPAEARFANVGGVITGVGFPVGDPAFGVVIHLHRPGGVVRSGMDGDELNDEPIGVVAAISATRGVLAGVHPDQGGGTSKRGGKPGATCRSGQPVIVQSCLAEQVPDGCFGWVIARLGNSAVLRPAWFRCYVASVEELGDYAPLAKGCPEQG